MNHTDCRTDPKLTTKRPVPSRSLTFAMIAGGLLLASSAGADTEQVEAKTSECMAVITEIDRGRIRLKKADDSGEKRKLQGVELQMPLCVVDFGRREIRVRLPDGQGEWWLKKRHVVKPELVAPIRCGEKGAMSNDKSGGGTRGSGEEPCK